LLSTGGAARRIFEAMTSTFPMRRASLLSSVEAYVGTIIMVGVSTLLGLWIAPRWGTAPVDMIYLPAVLAAAALWGLGAGLVAGIGAALAYNFFFTAPVHTFRMDRVADVVTVAVLLIVALVTSRLAAGIRMQARIASAHAARNATIAGFAGRLLSPAGEAEIAATASSELNRLFDCNAILVSGLPEPRVLAAVPPGNQLTPSDVAAAALTLQSGEPAGRGTNRLQPAEWVFHAVRSGGAALAAVGLARDDGAPPVDEERLPLLGNLLDQLALALERERLERETRDFAAIRQRDHLRLSLLSSIGDDVRPRLDAIAAGVRKLRRDPAADKQIVSGIGSEVLQLDRYIGNLMELGPEGDQQPIEAPGVSIDLFNRRVLRAGKDVHLTPKEYAVLAELAKHRGRVLSHAHLLRTVWGPAQENQMDYLRVAIRALRQKIEEQPSQPQLIINEPGVGYRLVA
jgi:two-component system, OmpR family, sensor histidine kinase KdpD